MQGILKKQRGSAQENNGKKCLVGGGKKGEQRQKKIRHKGKTKDWEETQLPEHRKSRSKERRGA